MRLLLQTKFELKFSSFSSSDDVVAGSRLFDDLMGDKLEVDEHVLVVLVLSFSGEAPKEVFATVTFLGLKLV